MCQQPFLSEVPNPQFKSSFKQIFDSVESFQIVSMLQGAVERGTGRRTKINGLEIAGKTGTTNSNTDAWFIGFTSDIIVGCLLYTSPSPRDLSTSRMPSSA